jgi:ribonuclease HI
LIEIYTDGASRGNPGPGAYAVILRHKLGEKIITQSFRKTTNNRMELMAVIAGLKAVKPVNQNIAIYSDSKYVVDAVNKGWITKWVAMEFKKIKNVDLWKDFIEHYKMHKINFFWIKGHSGHYENETCDALAQKAIISGNYEIDYGYESITC